MKYITISLAIMGLLLMSSFTPQQKKETMNTTLQLTQDWDKTFPKSNKVNHKKVTFKNRYGIELAADMYTPKAQQASLLPSP